jgi:hypothetical protein
MNEIKYFNVFLLSKMMCRVILEDADVTCVDWLIMLHSCISREVSLVGHTNISIGTTRI